MKQLIILVSILLIGSSSYATGLTKGSSQLGALGSAWKSHQAAPKLNPNDINMGYAGEDISRRPTLVPHIATV